MKREKRVLLLAAFLLLPTTPVNSKQDHDIITSTVGAAAIISTGVGCYVLFNWLTQEPNEVVLDNAYRQYTAYKNTYQTILTQFNEHRASLEHTRTVDEQALYALAVAKHTVPTTVYCTFLSSAVSDLTSSYTILLERAEQHNTRMLKDAMHATANLLKDTIDSLSLLHEIVTQHQAYFYLYEVESRLTTYKDVCMLIDNHLYDHTAQADTVRHFIATESSTHTLPFPRVEYLKKIDRDINRLEQALRIPAHTYPDRTHAATELLNKLKSIKSYVEAGTGYAQEATDYEHDQFEKECIRTARKRNGYKRTKAYVS